MMRLIINPGRTARRTVRAILADIEGMAAVELAIILPIALMLMALITYGGQAYSVQRKVTLGAMTVANIFAQGNNTGDPTITTAELNQILAYPGLILFPNDPTNVAVEVSQLLLTSNPATGAVTGTVVTSCANANGTKRPLGQTMSVDPDIAQAFTGQATSYVVLGEVQYPFQPPGIYIPVSTITLHDSIMMIPRTAAQITVNPPC
jgi:Flp pilus assembly protein TadG